MKNFVLQAACANAVGRPQFVRKIPGLRFLFAGAMAGLVLWGPESRGEAVADTIPLRPLEQSDLVKMRDGALVVAKKDGSGIDGVKLSQHDRLISSPSIAVAADGTIHVVFIEQHRTTYANAVYYRSSSDGGKTWSETKNLSEDMPNIDVARCQVLVDASNRVYVIWRGGLLETWPVNSDLAGAPANLWFRELEKGKWHKVKPIGETCTGSQQPDAPLSYFAAMDGAGRAQVIWNALPDKWHPELTKHGRSPGVGNGLVFQSTLDGTTASEPREIFLPVATIPANGWGISCDGLDTLNGYVDAGGAAHFVALATMPMYGSPQHKPIYELIENGKAGEGITLPLLSFHAAKDIPTLLVDAKGQRHVIALYMAGEHPNIRDYALGSDDDPTVIRASAGLNGLVDGFQACQGPGGRMVAIMQMNDVGQRSTDENYVSISTGDGKWSAPVNVSNNAGRQTYMSKNTSSESAVTLETGCMPGPGTAAFDKDGHVLLLLIKNEYGIAHSVAFGVSIAGGGLVTTATLRFLKF